MEMNSQYPEPNALAQQAEPTTARRAEAPRLVLGDTRAYEPLREGPDAFKEMANCKDMDPNTFFPKDSIGVEAAKMICNECVVRGECLEYALGNNEKIGVWGGASERDRRRIRRERKMAQ